MDLNNPTFCTQLDSAAGVEDPSVSEIRLSLKETRLGPVHEHGELSAQVCASQGNAGQVLAGEAIAQGAVGVHGAEGILSQDNEEVQVWSTPEGPYAGKMFDTLEEAKVYYNSYAKRIGFSVQTNTSRRSALTGVVEKVQFVCNKEGKGKKSKTENCVEQMLDGSDSEQEQAENHHFVQENGGTGRKRKRETMKYTQCKARMVVKQIGSRWHIIYFIAEHNHDLVTKPSLSKFLRSHKEIPHEEKKIITLLHGCNIRTGHIMQLMSEFYGSRKLVPYETKDVHNFWSTLRTVEKYKDMQETLDYFERLKQDDLDFFYRFELDEEYRIRSLFWVDSAARKAYVAAYHDCVSFDATYMTNMYDMPFCPIIGINKHGQTFQLGCAFIRDEKDASYVWLFKTFLEAMNGFAPLNIITDQDGAMRIGIQQVFPIANHRNCRWHIINKASGTVGPFLAKDADLRASFEDCINYSVTPEEFEVKWIAMVETYHLQGNQHFQHLYSLSRSFVPAFYMHNFYPFLQSTQRSEVYNGVLKLYGSPNFSILDFGRQYEKIQEKFLVDEDGQDFRTEDKNRITWSKNPIEKHAATVYTKNIFYKFSKEYEKIEEYFVKPEGEYQFKVIPNDHFVQDYGTLCCDSNRRGGDLLF